MTNEQLTERMAKAEARVLALMNACAAMLKHHPLRDDVEQTLGQLLELSECALLPKTHPECVAETIRATTVRVQQLSNIAFVPGCGPGQTPC